MKKITLSGGFHNCAPINISVPERTYESLRRGDVSITDYHVLTASQQRKLSAHFCGIRGCMCGGVARAAIKYND